MQERANKKPLTQLRWMRITCPSAFLWQVHQQNRGETWGPARWQILIQNDGKLVWAKTFLSISKNKGSELIWTLRSQMQPGNVRNIQRQVEDTQPHASCEHLSAGNYTMLASSSKTHPKEIISNFNPRNSSFKMAVHLWKQKHAIKEREKKWTKVYSLSKY